MRTTFVFMLLLSAACASPKPPPDPPPPPQQCAPNQFVACVSGEDCARRHGKLVRTHACHDRAASACEAAGCVHGCDVYNGEPKEIHCAVNASSTGHMKKCGGFSNWGCPENMTCEFTAEERRADDATGTCVRAAN